MSEKTNEQLVDAAVSLYGTVTNSQLKVDFGSRLREANRKMLEDGITPENYRMEYLKEARLECIDLLQKMSVDFGGRYMHDSLSVQDFVDILNSTVYMLREAGQKYLQKEPKD